MTPEELQVAVRRCKPSFVARPAIPYRREETIILVCPDTVIATEVLRVVREALANYEAPRRAMPAHGEPGHVCVPTPPTKYEEGLP